MRRRIACLHDSAAVVVPVARFYGEDAPDLEMTHLLDYRVRRWLAAAQAPAAERRLGEMFAAARDSHRAELALVACPAVSRAMLEGLREQAGLPVIRLEQPMASEAVGSGNRIGVIAAQVKTLENTRQVLLETAAAAGKTIAIREEVLPQAYQALLAGFPEAHRAALLGAARRLLCQRISALVLAEVSMARELGGLRERLRIPVFSCLPASLTAVRETLSH